MSLKKYSKDILRFLKNNDFEKTDGGILVHGSIMVQGLYEEGVNGKDFRQHKNLIPTAGITYLLGSALGGSPAAITAWYIAPLKSGTPVAGSLPSFVASNEVPNSGSGDGYSEATRQAWTAGAAAAGAIDNYSSKATFSIVCATQFNITGAALVSVSTIGSSSGTLVSASNFGTARTVVNGDSWQCGYKVTLTDS